MLRAAELKLEGHDIVCLAVPARALPAVLAAHGGSISSRVGVVVVSKGLVPPLATLPAAFAAERCNARAVAVLGGPAHAAEVLDRGASIVVASLDRGFARQLREALTAAKLDVVVTHRRHRRRAGRVCEERGRARRRRRVRRRPEHRRGRRRQGVRRG